MEHKTVILMLEDAEHIEVYDKHFNVDTTNIDWDKTVYADAYQYSVADYVYKHGAPKRLTVTYIGTYDGHLRTRG